jgi:hypothetical protein
MTTSPSPVLEAEQRAWRYWFADGLTNLVVGISALLMASCLLYTPRWPPAPLPMALWSIALVLYVVMGVRHREIVEWLKTKTTYPRAGYVQSPYLEDPIWSANLVTVSLGGASAAPPEEVRRGNSGRRTRMFLMLGLVVLASLGMITIHQRWVWAAEGVIVGAAMWIARKDYRLSWIVPVGFPFIGSYITIFVASRVTTPAYFLAGWGLLFLLDGGMKLIRFLLQNPAPKAPAA